MIIGEEQPDEGQVVGRSRRHHRLLQPGRGRDGGPQRRRRDDGRRRRRSAPWPPSCSELEHALADPDRADELDELIERFGEVQARFEELGGYALEARAREILAGLGFCQEMMDGDVGALSGGWKMRVALARILLMQPDAMLLDEPTNHLDLESIIWLEDFLKGYEGALVMTSHDREFMNRIVTKIVEIDGGELTTYSGNYDFYEQQRALAEKQQQAQYERQQAMLAKEIAFIERFKARASHAAQVQSRVKKLDKIEKVEPPKRRADGRLRLPAARRAPATTWPSSTGVHKALRRPRRSTTGFDFLVRRAGALVRDGRERRRQVARCSSWSPAPPSRTPATVTRRRQREARLLRAARDGAARRRADGVRDAGGRVPAGVAGLAAHAGRLLRLLRRRGREAVPRALGRREGAAGAGA